MWKYEKGEGRIKHYWRRPEAGFELDGQCWIGKCPKGLTQQEAEAILNRAFPLYESDEDAYPPRLYAVHGGVIYEAAPTRPGISYHGYPWRGDLPGRPRLPNALLTQLEAQARQQGELEDYRRWMKKYGG